MKQKQKPYRISHWHGIIISIILVAVAAQVVFDISLRHSLSQKASDNTITQLITMSVNNLYKPAATDAKTGTVYLPEARLVLPAIQSPGNQLLYSYNSTDSNDPELTITTNTLVHQGEAKLLSATPAASHTTDAQKMTAMFAQVPNLQACARGIQLYNHTQSTSNNSLQSAMALPLKDGHTLHGYRDTNCHEDMSPLQAELKQAQSY